MTLTDEGTIIGGVPTRRQQKIYSDILGRTVKTEALNWEGGSVYSATVHTYNARDQVTLTRQFTGPEGSATYQDTNMTYDGHGRLKTKHVPEQDAGAATVWDYNADDTIERITDARGASATYLYDGRHLVTGTSFNGPAGITTAPNVSFTYDATGNRISMTDGLGGKSYSYNQHSKLMSETVTFTGLGAFTLSYDYTLSGALKKVTDATNMTVTYGYDAIGRLTAINGGDNLYAGVSNYASNFQYFATGKLKAMTDGTSRALSLEYNPKMQPTHFEISNNAVSQDFTYFDDGRIRFINNIPDANFDRSYSYDHMARLKEANTGGLARGDSGGVPYDESFSYDPWSNLTERTSETWSTYAFSDVGSYTNNRRLDWGYDADGRNTAIGTRSNLFNSAGQQVSMTAQTQSLLGVTYTVTQTNHYDGDRLMGRQVRTQSNAPGSVTQTYYVRSSVLGGAILMEIDGNGEKQVGYVFGANGGLLAHQTNGVVTWEHVSPAGTGKYYSYSNSSTVGRVELDPVGADVGLTSPPTPDIGGGDGDIGSNHFGGMMSALTSNIFSPAAGCVVNGHSDNCGVAMAIVNFGTGRPTSMFANASVSMHELANSFGVVFQPAANSRMVIASAGTAGTAGHSTIEQAWSYAPGYGWNFGPTPTAYTGIAATPGSVVSLPTGIPGPQNPIKIDPQLDPNQLKRAHAFADADSVLLLDKNCRKFFTKGRSLAEVRDILQAFRDSATFDSNLGADATTTNSGTGRGASIKLSSYFFSDETQRIYTWDPKISRWVDDFGLLPRQHRAATILHEFAHALGLIPRDGRSADPTGQQSTKNDETIYNNCFKGLHGLPSVN